MLKLGVVVHAYNPSTGESEARGAQVLGQPGKKKKKKIKPNQKPKTEQNETKKPCLRPKARQILELFRL
jgi:hypothetical protein